MVYGNNTVYGYSIGILMLETTFPRIPGDIGNATTFEYPVIHKIIRGANVHNVVEKPDENVIKLFVEGAKELESQGVKAIVTSCGFTATFHKELAASVNIPVFSSSLMQVRLVHSMLKPDQKVGIITASKSSLNENHFKGVDILDVPKVVYGMENTSFAKMFFDKQNSINVQYAEYEMCSVAKKMISENNDIGAIVLECTNMPPFSKAVNEVTSLPVFDIITLTDYVHSAVVKKRYKGYM